jgi:hypothetical protein
MATFFRLNPEALFKQEQRLSRSSQQDLHRDNLHHPHHESLQQQALPVPLVLLQAQRQVERLRISRPN